MDRTEPSMILANYAGWGPGQLEGEFGVDSWLTLPATRDYVFWEEDETSGTWSSRPSTPGSSPSSSGSERSRADPSLN